MKFYLNQYLSLITFLIIPLVNSWNPSWLSLMGHQAYWPIFWLLPWAVINGPSKSILLGFLLGFALDTINADLYTQIPGLMICGLWFGKVGRFNQFNNTPIQFGLTAALGSFICGVIYFCQMFSKVLMDDIPFLIFTYGIQNIIAQVFLTGLLAPVFCKLLHSFFIKKHNLRI